MKGRGEQAELQEGVSGIVMKKPRTDGVSDRATP